MTDARKVPSREEVMRVLGASLGQRDHEIVSSYIEALEALSSPADPAAFKQAVRAQVQTDRQVTRALDNALLAYIGKNPGCGYMQLAAACSTVIEDAQIELNRPHFHLLNARLSSLTNRKLIRRTSGKRRWYLVAAVREAAAKDALEREAAEREDTQRIVLEPRSVDGSQA